MHFRTIASIALLACASSAQEILQPYRLAHRAAVPFQSLARRATPGYQPELSNCHDGATCAEACGQGYETCPSNDQQTHCFNPAKKQSCCTDGTGNSCDDGFYCTHDTKLQTWCCPQAMSLEQCAAAYNVGGSLAAATAKPTTTSAAPTTTSTTTSAKPTTPTTTTKASSTPVATTTKAKTTTTTSCPTPSATHASVWTPSANGTVTGATAKTQATVPVAVVPTAAPAPGGSSSSGAATTGISALLLVAAGAIALL